MRRLLLPVAACLAPLPAAAQPPRVPVPLIAHDGVGACSGATVIGLEGADGFLAVRAGPSTRERTLARLRQDQVVYACVRRGNWFGIVFERAPGERRCAHVLEPQRRNGVYRGPCGSGWVHYDYLGGYADWVSP